MPPPTKPPTKTKTQPGLGSGSPEGGIPRMDSAEMKRVRQSFRQDPDIIPDSQSASVRPRIRDSVRREDPDDPPPPRSEPTSAKSVTPTKSRSWDPEAPTGTRRKRSGRPPVIVDEVGTAAVKLARTTRRSDGAPKLVASRGMIAKAPIDTRAAFLLSLIDGRNTVDSIVDMSGMNEDEVKAILERLGRLGLISLP